MIGGISKKSCFCEKCALEHGVTDPTAFLSDELAPSSLSDSLVSPKAEGEQSEGSSPNTPGPLTGDELCPGCGFAFDDLKKTGRLGCRSCYQFFREEIKMNLGSMHKDTNHVGRVPAGMLQAFQLRQELEKLDKEMTEAINDEDYEKAASIRDEIQRLSAEPALDAEVTQSEPS